MQDYCLLLATYESPFDLGTTGLTSRACVTLHLTASVSTAYSHKAGVAIFAHSRLKGFPTPDKLTRHFVDLRFKIETAPCEAIRLGRILWGIIRGGYQTPGKAQQACKPRHF
jgi:hypothetical protein